MDDNKKSFSDIAHMSTLKDGETADEVELEDIEVIDEEVEDDAAEPAGSEASVEEQAEEPVERLVHSDPVYEITAQPTEEDMKRFMFSHTYLNPAGIVALVLALGAAGLVVYSIQSASASLMSIILGIAVLFLMCNSALTIYRKAKQYAKDLQEHPEHRITYRFSEAGLDLERGTEYMKHDWSEVTLVRQGKTCYYVYIGKNQAFAIPKVQLGAELDAFTALLRQQVDAKKLKF